MSQFGRNINSTFAAEDNNIEYIGSNAFAMAGTNHITEICLENSIKYLNADKPFVDFGSPYGLTVRDRSGLINDSNLQNYFGVRDNITLIQEG